MEILNKLSNPNDFAFFLIALMIAAIPWPA
jgi:hypothetical protein